MWASTPWAICRTDRLSTIDYRHSRWWSILSVAAQRALALSLIEVDGDAIKPLADFEPRVGEILADVRYELGPFASRLPLRG